ncbi:MAG TPA: Shedu anti-phage system protein SduA domain-containing protein [Coleofasciculaceae cyanobacterium]|jgi:hypothetical protein
MDLVTRADQFIKSGHPSELNSLLLDCVNSKSVEGLVAVKRLARDMYEDYTFNKTLKAPAAYCLLAWREEGLKALVENALEENTSKNFSLAFALLASLTTGSPPPLIISFLKEPTLLQAVEDAVGDWSKLAVSAQEHLNEVAMSIPDDDVALFTATGFLQLGLTDFVAVKHLTLALSRRWISVGPSVLKSYEQLLSEQADNEPAFQAFFERNPLFLDPMAFNVWTQPDFHGQKEPDFVIQRSDNSYVVVEIEVPSKPLMTKGNQLSADATHAITQVLEYRSFLLERFSDASMTFPNFSVPTGLVVIGMEQSLNSKQLSALRRENEIRHGSITVVGFDALAAKAEAISRNMMYGKLSVHSGRLR